MPGTETMAVMKLKRTKNKKEKEKKTERRTIPLMHMFLEYRHFCINSIIYVANSQHSV